MRARQRHTAPPQLDALYIVRGIIERLRACRVRAADLRDTKLGLVMKRVARLGGAGAPPALDGVAREAHALAEHWRTTLFAAEPGAAHAPGQPGGQ